MGGRTYRSSLAITVLPTPGYPLMTTSAPFIFVDVVMYGAGADG